MAAELIDGLLNLSMVFAILIAPSVLMLSAWYRAGLGKAVLVWPRSEMVVLTIVFFIPTLVLFIVGVSCMFTYLGYLDPIRLTSIDAKQFLHLGLCCNLSVIGLAILYFGMRNVLVQLVMETGVVVTSGILPLGNQVALLAWNQIADYYVVPDYPNVSITFIVETKPFQYERRTIKVPVYLKEEFQAYVDHAIQESRMPQSGSEISSSRYFSEN
ncbi:MAG: hypothetical protein RLZZ165_613 [Bacteroidota bacterium]